MATPADAAAAVMNSTAARFKTGMQCSEWPAYQREQRNYYRAREKIRGEKS